MKTFWIRILGIAILGLVSMVDIAHAGAMVAQGFGPTLAAAQAECDDDTNLLRILCHPRTLVLVTHDEGIMTGSGFRNERGIPYGGGSWWHVTELYNCPDGQMGGGGGTGGGAGGGSGGSGGSGGMNGGTGGGPYRGK
jgi:hypothetical protein